MAKQTIAKQKVTFSLKAPFAQSVLVAGDFTDWQEAALALKKGKDGAWSKTLTLAPGRYEYRFLVDGEWCDDPKASERQVNPFGGENCVLTIQSNGA
jgi:1,4-alpha-glucan branching enzyme